MNSFLLLLTISLLVVVQVRTVLGAPTATIRSQLNGLARDLGKECRSLEGGGDPAFYHRDRDRWSPTGNQGSRRA